MSYPIPKGLLDELQAKHVGVFNNAPSVSIHDLQVQQAELSNRAQTLQALADAESRELTAEEAAEVDSIMDEFNGLQVNIERRQRMQDQANMLQASNGIPTPQESPGGASDPQAGIDVVNSAQNPQYRQPPQARPAASRSQASFSRVEDSGPSRYGKNGFHNFGEYAKAVQNASKKSGAYIDPRLIMNAPTAVSTEGTNVDGGFAVPPDFRQEIQQKVMAEASIVGYTDQLTSSSNQLTFPKDETTPWQGTGGVRVNWTAEAAKIAESKVELGEASIKLHKLAALLPVSEELLEDAPALGRYIYSKVPGNMAFALNDAIINGTGTGQPAGILGAGALLTVDAEAGQVADTINYINIVKMWSSLYSQGKGKAVWLAHPQVDAQLMMMSFPGTGTAVPVYLPPRGAADTPYASLFGRPVIPTEACPVIGDKGDLILTDLTQYMTVVKTIGLRADVSMHLYFDYDVMAFRFILRFGGAPWWSSPILGKAAGVQYSAFVALAERA